jgi:hypothetical protein
VTFSDYASPAFQRLLAKHFDLYIVACFPHTLTGMQIGSHSIGSKHSSLDAIRCGQRMLFPVALTLHLQEVVLFARS